jgi:aerobic carbon-monoxide dehydrogenase large subunit
VTTHVGKRMLRIEDPPLLQGRGKFVADLAVGALTVRFVRSDVPAGSILAVDIPDGARVFTGEDLKDVKPIKASLRRPDYIATEQPVLPRRNVTYVGEPVAAVVADTYEEAEDLADEVFLDIDSTEAVAHIEAAVAPGAPQVHPHVPNNTVLDARFETSSLDEVFEGADAIVDVEIRSGRESHLPLETRGGYAEYDERTGRVSLSASIQSPHLMRTIIADLIGMPEADLQVIAPDVGGGFGQKMAPTPEYVVLVWLARELKRSVRWIEDRRENLLSGGHGRDNIYRVRGAFSTDGTFLALDADVICNAGSYSFYPVTAGLEALMALSELPGPYQISEYRVRSRAIATNTCPSGTYRGISRPNITLTLERMMDMAARKLSIDPVAIRRRNLIQSFPYRSPTGLIHDEGSYVGALERAVQMVDLPSFRMRQGIAREAGRYLGIGFSTYAERTGYGTPAFVNRAMEVLWGYETVELVMDPSGNVEARIGASPHGQGLVTSLTQLIADEVGISTSAVRISHSDTDKTPYGWGTFASRSMVICGGACMKASRRLKERLIDIASELLESDPHDVEINEGRASIKGTNRGMDVPELARVAYYRSQEDLRESPGPGLVETATYDPPGTFSNACQVAIVEVDIGTGQVGFERFVVVEDAGLLINPMIVDGQIHGGVAQGIAGALYEEVIYDESANILTASLMDYLLPTASEMPFIEIEHLETISDATITGAKGVGEGATQGAPAAVLNAISDALSPFGIEVLQTPATPARILALIKGHAEVESP